MRALEQLPGVLPGQVLGAKQCGKRERHNNTQREGKCFVFHKAKSVPRYERAAEESTSQEKWNPVVFAEHYALC